jgi:hypothetical protein
MFNFGGGKSLGDRLGLWWVATAIGTLRLSMRRTTIKHGFSLQMAKICTSCAAAAPASMVCCAFQGGTTSRRQCAGGG